MPASRFTRFFALWSGLSAMLLPLSAAASTPADLGPGILLPWQFSPIVFGCVALALGVYVNGLRVRVVAGRRCGIARPFMFILGVLLIYGVLQTRFDYWAQHMFYFHRLQHLVLLHLGPFLVALSVPGRVLRDGLPHRLREHGADALLDSTGFASLRRFLLSPWRLPLLFIAGIAVWLEPTVNYYAMLSWQLYDFMNLSVVATGLLFWALVLDPEPAPPARIGYGQRILVLVAVIFPQIVIGAILSLSRHDLYNVYGICGRLYPLSPVTDQQIGGLLIWGPGSMMSVIGMLVVLSHINGRRRAARFYAPRTHSKLVESSS